MGLWGEWSLVVPELPPPSSHLHPKGLLWLELMGTAGHKTELGIENQGERGDKEHFPHICRVQALGIAPGLWERWRILIYQADLPLLLCFVWVHLCVN